VYPRHQALAAAALLSTLSGCATTDADGCATDDCRTQVAETKARWNREDQARAREAAAQRSCASADANPAAAPPGFVRQCHLTRWQQSGIACSDVRVTEQLLEVTCEVPIRGSAPDLATAAEMIQRRAATATLAAGRTHMMIASDETPIVRYASGGTAAVTCPQQIGLAPVFGPVAVVGLGGGNSTCYATSLGASAVGVTVRRRFELLSESDAAARTTRDLPPERQPQSARQINEAYAGFP
jgi:hypothetical protein